MKEGVIMAELMEKIKHEYDTSDSIERYYKDNPDKLIELCHFQLEKLYEIKKLKHRIAKDIRETEEKINNNGVDETGLYEYISDFVNDLFYDVIIRLENQVSEAGLDADDILDNWKGYD